MKKRVIGWILGLVALVFMLSSAVWAVSANEHDQADEWGQLKLLGDVEALDLNVMMVAGNHSHSLSSTNNCSLDNFTETIDFNVALTNDKLKEYVKNSGEYVLPTGNYYLTEDLNLGNQHLRFAEDSTVNICLNGHIIDGTNVGKSSVIYQFTLSESTLHICDCSDAKSGQIKSGDVTAISSHNSLYLHSGKITNSCVTDSGYGTGAGIRVAGDKGVLHIYGAEISQNSNMNGGGGIYFGGKEFKFYGGSVTNNSATGNGGGIIFSTYYTGELEISGEALIKNNKANSVNNDIHFAVQNGNMPHILVKSSLPADAKIYITTDKLPDDVGQFVLVKAVDGVSINISNFVYSGDDRYNLIIKDNQLILRQHEAEYQPVSGNKQSGTFEAMWNKAAADGGTVKLLQDVTATNGSFGTGDGFDAGAVKVPSSKIITLDLNGHTLSRGLTAATANGHVIVVNGSLTIRDASDTGTNSGTGTITGGYTDGYGGGINIASGGTLNLSSGTISGNTATGKGGGGVYVAATGKFNMNGGVISSNQSNPSSTSDSYGGGGVYVAGTFKMTDGTISSNTSNNNGGGVHIYAGNASEMSGGTISGNTASSGGGVYVFKNMRFKISGGTISSNQASSNGAGILVDGSTDISNVTISNNISSYNGGGIYVYNMCNVTMSNTKITGNQASQNGGGVYICANAVFTMSDIEITGNQAGQRGNGGGIYAAENFNVYGKVIIKDNKGKNNSNTMSSNLPPTDNNVYLCSNKYINITGDLSNDSVICVQSELEYNSVDTTSNITMWLSLLISQRKSPDYGIYRRI